MAAVSLTAQRLLGQSIRLIGTSCGKSLGGVPHHLSLKPQRRTISSSSTLCRQTHDDKNNDEHGLRKEGHPQTWSEYMGDAHAGDDSPWASLDAFADRAQLDASHNTQTQSATSSSHAPLAAQHNDMQDDFERAAELLAAKYAAQTQASKMRDASPVRHPMAAAAAAAAATNKASPLLTHIDSQDPSRANMVDVSHKSESKRTATAVCRVYVPDIVLSLLDPATHSNSQFDNEQKIRRKGPVLHTAQLAGIMAAKRTSQLIPLCHSINLAHVDVQLDVVQSSSKEDQDNVDQRLAQHYINVTCTASTISATGVEMEALMGANVASLTLWDMLKSVAGQTMRIDGLMVVRKSGGKSGDFQRTPYVYS